MAAAEAVQVTAEQLGLHPGCDELSLAGSNLESSQPLSLS